MKLSALLLALLGLSIGARCASFDLSNGYLRVSGHDGIVTSLRVDATGKGLYDASRIVSFRVGDPVIEGKSRVEIDSAKHTAVFPEAQVAVPTKVEQLESNSPAILEPGHTLGQSFVFPHGRFDRIEFKLPTWHTSDSAVTAKLYRIDGDAKTEVASQRLADLQDNAWASFSFPEKPAGKYIVELSDLKGKAGWWSLGGDAIEGDALADGVANSSMDRAFRVVGHDIVAGEYVVALEGRKLRIQFTPPPGQASPQLTAVLKIPWIKSGYDTTSDRIIFDHFLTSTGLYVPVHQLKRRPFSGVSGDWVVMSGRFGWDMRFTNAPIHLSMEEDSMSLTIPGSEREIELLPHSSQLSEQFPSFFTSDPKIDKALNQFLLSHNFNFGVGTNPDWKDWHTLQLAWTANHQADVQHLQFLNYKMAADGYVYCWGSSPGWPFPYSDADKDGNNDIDTRHFTTNPCFITGAWREYCWNPDAKYLEQIMPRVRRAMEFILGQCDGDKGVLTIHAKGHEGKDRCIGSNYWDISPFGWKDAFTNAHYYPSIEAMAQLEEAVLRNPEIAASLKDAAPPARTPDFYRKLAKTVRKSYNDTFWVAKTGRYSGCVDIDGVSHDYGFTYVNLPAMAYGLADPDQVKSIYNWMEHGVSSTGKADIYSRWTFAPRACATHIPARNEPQQPVPSWWCLVWTGTPYDVQCQDGGAILYTSFYDVVARAKYIGANNAWKRFTTILDRYSEPDHLSGGSPLYRGESTQGGPGGGAGSVGVEGEFPESGLVPVSFFYAFLGIDADINGLKIKPNLPKSIEFAGVRHVRYSGKMYDIRVTNSSVELKCTTKGSERTIRKNLKPGETFRFRG